MPAPRCFMCRIYDGDVQERSLKWHVRPKKKYNKSDYFDNLLVDLCTSCWECNKDHCLVGWDWYDAVDGLKISSDV
jgi:hypothetical protein